MRHQKIHDALKKKESAQGLVDMEKIHQNIENGLKKEKEVYVCFYPDCCKAFSKVKQAFFFIYRNII